MIRLPHFVRVFLHAPATDLRKGFDALCGLVTTDLHPGSSCPYLVGVVDHARRKPQNPALDPSQDLQVPGTRRAVRGLRRQNLRQGICRIRDVHQR